MPHPSLYSCDVSSGTKRTSHHVTHALVCGLTMLGYPVTCLFFQLPDCSLCRILTFVYQASWHLHLSPECYSVTLNMLVCNAGRLQLFDKRTTSTTTAFWDGLYCASRMILSGSEFDFTCRTGTGLIGFEQILYMSKKLKLHVQQGSHLGDDGHSIAS